MPKAQNMNLSPIPTLVLACACLAAAACRKEPPPPAAVHASPAPTQPGYGAATAPIRQGEASAAVALPPIQSAPTEVQKQALVATLQETQAKFVSLQQATAAAYVKRHDEWKVARAHLAQMQKEMMDKMASSTQPGQYPGSTQDKASLEKLLAEGSLPEPAPPRGDIKANQTFDGLIYQFRQAMEARDHAKAITVAKEMEAVNGEVSPDLMAAYMQVADGYLKSAVTPASNATPNFLGLGPPPRQPQ